jgi:hypothetical protein
VSRRYSTPRSVEGYRHLSARAPLLSRPELHLYIILLKGMLQVVTKYSYTDKYCFGSCIVIINTSVLFCLTFSVVKTRHLVN